MNLCGRPPYQKGQRRKKSNRPADAERAYWSRVSALGCIVGPDGCLGRTTIHHCGTGGGGRKDHRKVIGLCWEHHLGDSGVNSLSGKMSRREWESLHGTEEELLLLVERLLAPDFSPAT